jgi:transposase InsO family protein
MTLEMDDSKIKTIQDVQRFLRGANGVGFKGASRQAKYAWLEHVIKRFGYHRQNKSAKGLLRRYMQQVSGLSRPQLTRLISRHLRYGKLKAKTYTRHRFAPSYTRRDHELLAETDNLHGRLSGPATKRIIERQHRIFGDERFARLAAISSSHIYNLRESPSYRLKAITVSRTKAVQVPIGVRCKPKSGGRPGYVRVDTVHQGDKDGEKGVYHINLVDEVLQWEIVVCVAAISEAHLKRALTSALAQFPYRILGFHSDNGGEFINRTVAELLNELLIEQTKSRSCRSNDNALVEGKNGSVIRKHIGHWHISSRWAEEIDSFYRECFNEYLNYHRPCGFATVTVDERGRRHRKYKTYMTPYERFLTLKEPEQYLRPGMTLTMLEAIAKAHSDNEYAAIMRARRDEILRKAAGITVIKAIAKGGMAKNTTTEPRRDISGSLFN